MAEEQSSKTEGKKSKKTLVIVGLSVLILALGGGFFWMSGLGKKYIGGDQKSGPEISGTAAKGKTIGPTYSMGNFIVNLNDQGGRRYLKLKAELELNNKKVQPLVEQQLPQLRDSIILLLSSKSFEEIASMDGKMRLRQEMLARLNHHLGKGKLSTIYFTEFVVQ